MADTTTRAEDPRDAAEDMVIELHLQGYLTDEEATNALVRITHLPRYECVELLGI